MEKKTKVSVNLASNKKVSVGNIFYKWAFEAGRAIVILIELIALGALGYRFLVDAEINDLHDEINRQASLVQFQADEERRYRGIQERLLNIEIINEETGGKIEIVNDIIASIRSNEFSEADYSITQNAITLSGNALSVFTVENFVNRIQNYPQVNSIIIDEINTSTSGIRFSIRISLLPSKLET